MVQKITANPVIVHDDEVIWVEFQCAESDYS